mmetsp:Transcript_20900/g.53400  ORF Transcript_20900/g.53400 Transcript_20900/m.53400 type:complete len:320 (-) Transcript_20900:482-1441(-)
MKSQNIMPSKVKRAMPPVEPTMTPAGKSAGSSLPGPPSKSNTAPTGSGEPGGGREGGKGGAGGGGATTMVTSTSLATCINTGACKLKPRMVDATSKRCDAREATASSMTAAVVVVSVAGTASSGMMVIVARSLTEPDSMRTVSAHLGFTQPNNVANVTDAFALSASPKEATSPASTIWISITVDGTATVVSPAAKGENGGTGGGDGEGGSGGGVKQGSAGVRCGKPMGTWGGDISHGRGTSVGAKGDGTVGDSGQGRGGGACWCGDGSGGDNGGSDDGIGLLGGGGDGDDTDKGQKAGGDVANGTLERVAVSQHGHHCW